MESERTTAKSQTFEILNDDKLLVPSLRNIACRYLQPPFPPEDERYFKMNSMPLWSYNSSSDEGSEPDDNRPDNNPVGDWKSETNESRFITLKSPKVHILMEKKEFLDHCDLVRSGSKRLQKTAMFDLNENKSEPNIHGLTDVSVAHCIGLGDNVKDEPEKNLKKVDNTEKTQNKLSNISESNTSDIKNDLSSTHKNEIDVESKVPKNCSLSTEDHYSRKSVIDLVKHFEQIHLQSKNQSKKKASSKQLSTTKNS